MKYQKSNSGGPKYNVTDSRRGKQLRGQNKFPIKRVGAKIRQADVFKSKYISCACRFNETSLFLRQTETVSWRGGPYQGTTVKDEADGSSEIISSEITQTVSDPLSSQT